MDLTDMTDDELRELRAEVADELRRRKDDLPEVMDSMLRHQLADQGRVKGEPWESPTGAHDAHPMGWEVTHDGRLWVSLVHGNVHEPGVSGWREITADDEAPPLWVQPSGGHDAYQKGDLVSYDDGEVWMSVIDNNSWSPSTFGWERVK